MLTIRSGQTPVRAVVFTPDGIALAVAHESGPVRVFHTARGALLGGWAERPGPITGLAVTPDGRSLVVGTIAGAIDVIPLDGRNLRPQPRRPGLRWGAWVGPLAVLPDGHTLVWLRDGGPQARDLTTAETRWTGPSFPFTSLSLSRDGRTLAAGRGFEGGGAAVLLDTASGDVIHDYGTFPAPVTAVALGPDGRTLAALSGPVLRVRSPEADDVRVGSADGPELRKVAFHPGGRLVAVAAADGAVRIFDAQTGAEGAAFDFGTGPATAVAFAPDGMRAAAGGEAGRVVVWDVDV
jgi:WD40 repeat protein